MMRCLVFRIIADDIVGFCVVRTVGKRMNEDQGWDNIFVLTFQGGNHQIQRRIKRVTYQTKPFMN